MYFPIATRAYSIACAVIALAMFPRFVASFGVVREYPFTLNARSDIVAVSFDGGDWLPSRGIAVARLSAGLPAGMEVCHRSAAGVVRCGTVRQVPEAPARSGARVVTAILAIAFVLAGAMLAMIGVDRRAHAAAGMLAGIGLLFSADFLEPTLAGIRDLSMQHALLVVWEWFPRYAGLLCMLIFAREFPSTLPRSRGTTAILATMTALVVSSTFLNGISHVPGLLENASLSAQRAVISLILLNQKLVYAGAALGVITLAILQRKRVASRPAQQRRRARIVAGAILFGFAPPMTLGLVQVVSRIATGTRPVPFPLIAASFLTLLAVPAAVITAVMAKRVDSMRVMARRALLFTMAERVFPLLLALPAIGIALLLYANRKESIESAVAKHPIAFMTMLSAMIVLFVFGNRLPAAVRTYFARNDAAAREHLARLSLLVARSESIERVASVFEREIDAAWNPESIALLLCDEGERQFRGVGCDVPVMSTTSAIAVALVDAHSALPASLLVDRDLPEIDRHWMTATGAALLVPLLVSDKQLLGILAIGEKASQLPFDEAESATITTIAATAALTIENLGLRARPVARASSSPRPDDDSALVCPLCQRYENRNVTSRCPVDDSELQHADVPYVLAGKYRFEQRLGAGGMGVVYRARDLELERDVAIKTLPHLSPETALRLRREARTAANLLHPNLATVFAVETWRGTPMLILEYLDDGTLADRVSRGPLPFDVILRCGISIAEALGHVHARTILHRDVKPSNIGFSRAAGAKLLDFGLARFVEEKPVIVPSRSGEPSTVSSGVVGTPAYLSPEAVRGEPPHPDFDLWGLSLTLYEAVTGSNPFVGHSIAATMNAILTLPLPDPRQLRSDCSQQLSRFLIESLSRQRELRPRSANEFVSQLLLS